MDRTSLLYRQIQTDNISGHEDQVMLFLPSLSTQVSPMSLCLWVCVSRASEVREREKQRRGAVENTCPRAEGRFSLLLMIILRMEARRTSWAELSMDLWVVSGCVVRGSRWKVSILANKTYSDAVMQVIHFSKYLHLGTLISFKQLACEAMLFCKRGWVYKCLIFSPAR